jgi:succinyl-diaminopimelate desuccinylase
MSDVSPSEYIRAHREDLISLALDLLAIDTANPPGDTREIVTEIERFLKPLPVDVERVVANPAKPNLLVRVPGKADQTLLYNGHLDTVPFDADVWTHDPLGEHVEDRVYGRGVNVVCDSGYAATNVDSPIDLLFAFVIDEEVGGGAGLPALLEESQLDVDACMIGELTCEGDRHSVTVADRGSIWLTLEASGEGAHGSRPPLGVNAIDRLYDGVETMRERFGAK